MDYTKRLQGRIAIITGASRKKGLGTAICRSLAEAGADVFFTYWRSYDETMDWGAEPEWPDKLAGELRSFGVRVSHLEIDLMRVDAPTQILDKVAAELGQPSILVN